MLLHHDRRPSRDRGMGGMDSDWAAAGGGGGRRGGMDGGRGMGREGPQGPGGFRGGRGGPPDPHMMAGEGLIITLQEREGWGLQLQAANEVERAAAQHQLLRMPVSGSQQ